MSDSALPSSSHSRGRSAAPWLAMVMLLITPLAVAQNGTREVTPFRITHRSGEVGFESHYIEENQAFDSGDDVSFSNTSFQEYLLYRLNGFVYNPRFLDFRTRFKLGLLQQSIDRSGGSDQFGDGGSHSATLYGYDFYLHFLKEHPLSAILLASRERDAVIEIFTDRQIIENERYGLILNYKEGPLPWDLALTRNRVQEWGADSYSDSTYNLFEFTMRNTIRKRMDTELRYRLLDYTQDFEADNRTIDIERTTELQSHDLGLINTIYLAEDRRSRLNSQVRYHKQSGDQEFENFSWQERLALQHTPTFSTYYLLSLLENQFEDSDVRTWRAEAGLDHELYESLRTHLDVHGRWVDFDGSEENQTGVTGRLEYRKTTPWGLLSAGYAYTLDQIERTGNTSQRPIIDESLTLRDGVTAFLSRTGVIPASIEVTDPSGVTVFDEGFDYEIVEQGNRIGLRLIVGGRIADGESVLVDYTVVFTQDIEYDQSQQEFHARYEFDRMLRGLMVYYRWQELENHGAPTDDLSILEYTDWAAGANYNWRWLTAAAEFERYRSNFSDYDQISARLEGRHRINDHMRWGWNVGLLQTEYLDSDADEDHSDAVFAGLLVDGRLGREGFWSLEGRARDETGIIEETVLGLVAKLGWRWRRLRVEGGARFESRERFDSTRDRAQCFLQVAREFGQREVDEW